MAYQKAYQEIGWENYPSNKTPLNERNLNKIDYAVNVHDDRIITLDVVKLDKITANGLIKDIQFDKPTGIFTITYLDNSVITIDTLLEKLAVNFGYDASTQELIIVLDDGTEKRVDLSALITQFEFLNSDRIYFTVSADGKVTADIKDNSIGEEKLRVDYLAEIKKESAKAEAERIEAANQALLAKSYAVGGTGIREDEEHTNTQYFHDHLEELYHISRLCDGETPILRRMTPITIDATTPQFRATKEGMYFNGDTPQQKVDNKEGI